MIMFGPQLRQGDAQGAISAERFEIPLAWGAARCSPRGGNHPRPGLPLGETGKGET
jgi:hypothetical protein